MTLPSRLRAESAFARKLSALLATAKLYDCAARVAEHANMLNEAADALDRAALDLQQEQFQRQECERLRGEYVARIAQLEAERPEVMR